MDEINGVSMQHVSKAREILFFYFFLKAFGVTVTNTTISLPLFFPEDDK